MQISWLNNGYSTQNRRLQIVNRGTPVHYCPAQHNAEEIDKMQARPTKNRTASFEKCSVHAMLSAAAFWLVQTWKWQLQIDNVVICFHLSL